jgi:hypothetical protein
MRERRSTDEERRKIFRRMTWVYVYLPPLLAIFIAMIGSTIVAFLVPIEGTTFWGRWALGMLVILVLPAIVFATKTYLKR